MSHFRDEANVKHVLLENRRLERVSTLSCRRFQNVVVHFFRALLNTLRDGASRAGHEKSARAPVRVLVLDVELQKIPREDDLDAAEGPMRRPGPRVAARLVEVLEHRGREHGDLVEDEDVVGGDLARGELGEAVVGQERAVESLAADGEGGDSCGCGYGNSNDAAAVRRSC